MNPFRIGLLCAILLAGACSGGGGSNDDDVTDDPTTQDPTSDQPTIGADVTTHPFTGGTTTLSLEADPSTTGGATVALTDPDGASDTYVMSATDTGYQVALTLPPNLAADGAEAIYQVALTIDRGQDEEDLHLAGPDLSVAAMEPPPAPPVIEDEP